jgi:hypothetical protein
MPSNFGNVPIEFEGFEWDRGNGEKCQKHGMTLADTSKAFSTTRS